ncbi:MAG: ParA family protein [Sulfolobaceae archaeon]
MILTVVNQKGGVGKTTVAVNLAYLSSKTKKTALIDLDPEGGATISFGMRRNIREIPFLSFSVNLFGIDIFPSNISLIKLEVSGNIEDITRSLQEVSKEYEVVIIDTPPNFGKLSVSGMIVADKILAPVTPHPLVIEASKNLDYRLYTLKKKAISLTNMSRKPIEIKLQNIQFLSICIPSSKLFIEASKLGVPALRYEEVKMRVHKLRNIFEELLKVITNE